MITPPRTTRSVRQHPTTLAAAAAMTGLIVLFQPGLAHAATSANVTAGERVKTTVLHPTISGTDGALRYSLASLTGGGVQLSFVLVPSDTTAGTSQGDQAQHKDFTLTVDAKAVATQTVVDDGAGIVPATSTDKSDGDDKTAEEENDKTAQEKDQKKEPAEAETPNAHVIQGKATSAIVDQDVSQDSTTVTLQASSKGEQTIWVLPEQAPAAKDPDDQSWVTRTWHALLDKITGGNDSSSNEDDSDSTDGSSNNGTDQGQSTPTSAPTTSPTSSATSSPTVSASSTPDGSSSSSPSTASSTGTPTSTATAGDGTCVITHGDAQLTTTAGDDTVDAPLVGGPTAAPTFSDEVRKKAAQQASDCGEGSDDAGSSDEAAGSSTPSSGKTKVNLKAGDWLSGISDQRAAMEKLRGVDAEVATTWADASGSVAQLEEGSEYGPDKWDKSLIIGIPPFPQGSSWEDTAAGKNDDYLRTTFSTMKTKWAGRNGQAFVEYGWEMNGSWMWWSAKAGQEDAVGKAFARARSIQQAEFSDALLGVRFNHESNGYDGNSENLIVSIKDFVDFIGASYYDAYPSSPTKAAFDERANMRDGGGGPKGIQTWLAAAKAAGLPIEFGEWASSAKDGDHPAFIEGMHDEFAENAGPGAGQIFAESYFAVDKDNDNWRLTSGKLPQSEAAYAKAFSDVG